MCVRYFYEEAQDDPNKNGWMGGGGGEGRLKKMF
jgi:hypothetical protein